MRKKRNKILFYILIILIIVFGLYCLNIVKSKVIRKQLNGKIVYSSDRNLYIMEIDKFSGSLVKVTLPKGISGLYPSWSPDGKRIVFVKREGGSANLGELLIVNTDGSNLQRFLSMENIYYPSWSPDGTKIAFLVNPKVIHDEEGLPYYGLRYLYVTSVDNPVPRRVIDEGCSMGIPSWSPDSKRILFASSEGPGGIYIVNEDGTDLKMVGSLSGLGSSSYIGNIKRISKLYLLASGLDPSWSPDGKKIAFRYKNNIYITDLDGKNVHLLVRNYSPNPMRYNFHPQIVWSPDGEFIIYSIPAWWFPETYRTMVVSTRHGWLRTSIRSGNYWSGFAWTK